MGRLRFSVCFKDDVVRIISSVLPGNTSGLPNVVGPYAPSIQEIATLAGQFIGRERNFKVLSEQRSEILIADTGLIQRSVNPLVASFRAGLVQTTNTIWRK